LSTVYCRFSLIKIRCKKRQFFNIRGSDEMIKGKSGRRSIRTKLLVSFLVVSLVPLIFVMFAVSNLFSNELIKTQQEAYSELVFSKAEATDQWLQQFKTQIKTLSNSETFLSL